MVKEIDILLAAGLDKLEKKQIKEALHIFDQAIDRLSYLKPSTERDVLIAKAYLARGQALASQNKKAAIADLSFGVSYARSTKQPAIRALAEKCINFLNKLQVTNSQNEAN